MWLKRQQRPNRDLRLNSLFLFFQPQRISTRLPEWLCPSILGDKGSGLNSSEDGPPKAPLVGRVTGSSLEAVWCGGGGRRVGLTGSQVPPERGEQIQSGLNGLLTGYIVGRDGGGREKQQK